MAPREWPTSGPGGYINPAAWGVPNPSQRGTKSEVAHKWARWLPHGGLRRFRVRDKIRDCPQGIGDFFFAVRLRNFFLR